MRSPTIPMLLLGFFTFTYYIVRDLGKFDKRFVQLEFDKFLHSFDWGNVMKELKQCAQV